MKWMIAALCCAGFSQAAQPDYFPLQVGNRWVLQTTAAAPETSAIEVLRSRVVRGTTYYLVAGYAPSDTWLREAADGTIYALDASGAEKPLAALAAGASVTATPLSGCAQNARAAATGAYKAANFDIADSLTVTYTPEGCADIGYTQEIYGAGIGPVRRASTTIRGAVVYDLVYARVDGRAVIGRSGEIVVADDFSRGSHGWLAGFSDYTLQTGDLQFLAELRPLPEEVDGSHNGFYVQSMNRADDVFMYLKKTLDSQDGLAPDTTYRISFDLRFASNAASGCMGVGGSPGESVYLKAGATLDEPVAVLDGGGYVRLTADKGQQASGGMDAAVIGNVANGMDCNRAFAPVFVTVRRQSGPPMTVRTDSRGSLWLLVGTDSGFEGLTGLYYQAITARIVPAQTAVVRLPKRRR